MIADAETDFGKKSEPQVNSKLSGIEKYDFEEKFDFKNLTHKIDIFIQDKVKDYTDPLKVTDMGSISPMKNASQPLSNKETQKIISVKPGLIS